MAKSNILVYFTTKAGNYNGRMAVCACAGSRDRHYQLIEGLVDPEYDKWNKHLQVFESTTKNSLANNDVLMETRIILEILIRTGKAKTPAQLLRMFKDENCVKKYRKTNDWCDGTAGRYGVTLGSYVASICESMQKIDFSRNYQLYQALYHNLLGISKKTPGHTVTFEPPTLEHEKLADIPIEEIENRHLAAFGEWLKRVKKGSNYRGLTVRIMAVMRKAQKEGINTNLLTYDFKKNAPREKIKTLSGAVREHMRPKSLTPKQINEIFSLNMEDLPRTDGAKIYWYQLYRDTTRLMYLLMSRPADVVTMTWDMVVTQGNTHTLSYIPFKKKGLPDLSKHIVKAPICEEAWEIMCKYKGRSKADYILPYPDNDKRYDINTTEGNREWTLGIARSVRKVDSFLKIIGKHIGLTWSLSLYAFRRSAITHSLESGVNVMKVAKRAGTGLAMIDKHYYQDQGM